MANTYVPEFTLFQEAFTELAVLGELGIISIILAFFVCVLITRDASKWKLIYFPSLISLHVMGIEMGTIGRLVAIITGIVFILEIMSIQVIGNIIRGVGEGAKLASEKGAKGFSKAGHLLAGSFTQGRKALEISRGRYEKSEDYAKKRTSIKKSAEIEAQREMMTDEEKQRQDLASLKTRFNAIRQGISPKSATENMSDRERAIFQKSPKLQREFELATIENIGKKEDVDAYKWHRFVKEGGLKGPRTRPMPDRTPYQKSIMHDTPPILKINKQVQEAINKRDITKYRRDSTLANKRIKEIMNLKFLSTEEKQDAIDRIRKQLYR